MAKKAKKQDKVENQNLPAATEEETEELKPVTVIVTREHVLSPHSIKLRRDEQGLLIEAVTVDHAAREPLGAKTVQQILSENGAETLLRSNEEKLVISFSPLTGEIVSISIFEENATVDEEK